MVAIRDSSGRSSNIAAMTPRVLKRRESRRTPERKTAGDHAECRNGNEGATRNEDGRRATVTSHPAEASNEGDGAGEQDQEERSHDRDEHLQHDADPEHTLAEREPEIAGCEDSTLEEFERCETARL
jgi:hypothetical protein